LRSPLIAIGVRVERGRAGRHETAVVELDGAGEPCGIGIRADENEQGAGLDRVPLAGSFVLGHHRRECTVSVHLPDLGARPHSHAGVLVDLVDEISGHGFVQVVAADHHVHPGNPRGEEDRRLPRGVTTPDDDDGPRAAHQRFLKGGGVVHAVALERFDSRDSEPSIPGSRGQHHSPGHHRPTVRERYPVLAAVGFQPGDLRGDDDPRSELAGLQNGPFGKVGSGDSAGESEVVLDSR